MSRRIRATMTALVLFALLLTALAWKPRSAFAVSTTNMNINGQSIKVDNLSNTSNGRVNVLLGIADTIIGQKMRSGDRIVVSNRFIVWMDLTYQVGSDQVGGGFIRGLWSLNGSGENLNFRPNGAWNELLTSSENTSGAGHTLIIAPEAGDITNQTFFASSERNPTIALDGNVFYPPAPDSPYIAYQFRGYFTRNDGAIDAGAAPGTQSMLYDVQYLISRDNPFIRITQSVQRSGDNGNVNASHILTNFDTLEAWGASTAFSGPGQRPLRYIRAGVARQYIRSGVGLVANLNPNDTGTLLYKYLEPSYTTPEWIENSSPSNPGYNWTMSESASFANNTSTRTLRISIDTSYVNQYPIPRVQPIYTPAINAYSFGFNMVEGCPVNNSVCGQFATPQLTRTWRHDSRFDLYTTP
jgi:hypothetical protein